MSDLSNYAEKWLLDQLSGFSPSANRWLALFTAVTDPEAGTGTEVSTGAYARQPITFDEATLGAGATTNSNTPTFAASGAGFGTVTHTAVCDAVSGGNKLTAIKAMPVPKTVDDGDSLEFAPGDVDMVLA